MGPYLVAGTASRALGASVASALGTGLAGCEVERFPDGELRPRVGEVQGEDVYVLQSTGPPVNDHVVELLLLVDACRRAGAGRVTGVVPYFGYARQDRRVRPGQAVGARVCADALVAAGGDRLVVVDPHTPALEAVCAVPVEMLTAVPVLVGGLGVATTASPVVVAPDLGATKLAERYASSLGGPVAVVRKTRLSSESVRAREVVGGVANRAIVIVDDMISTGATIEAAIDVLRSQGANGEVVVAATHGPLVAGAMARIAAAGVRRAVVTDTCAPPDPPAAGVGTAMEVCSVAPLLADAIGRLHRNEPLEGLRLSI